MKVISIERTKLTVNDLAKLAQAGPVILTKKGRPLAAVSNMSGSDWESVSLARNPRFIALIEESRKSYKEEGGLSLKDVRKQLGLEATQPRKSGGRKRRTRGAK